MVKEENFLKVKVCTLVKTFSVEKPPCFPLVGMNKKQGEKTESEEGK